MNRAFKTRHMPAVALYRVPSLPRAPQSGVPLVLERFALFSFRRRRAVLGVWLVLLIGLGMLQGVVGSAFRTEFRLPSTESKRGFDTLKEAFPGQAAGGLSGTVVFRADQGVDDPAVKAAMSKMFEGIEAIRVSSRADEALRVESPYEPGGEQQIASTATGAAPNPEAGKIAYATVDIPADFDQSDLKTVTSHVEDLTPHISGLQVELGGEVFAKFEAPSSEVIGLVGAIFILLIAFGSVLAIFPAQWDPKLGIHVT